MLSPLSCKSQRALLQLHAVMSYLLLGRHWNMCNKSWLAFFTFFLLATFLIRLKKKKATSSLLSKEFIKKTDFFFTCFARGNHKHKTLVSRTEQQRSMARIMFRSCSLTFSELLFSLVMWLFLCCGMGMNVILQSLLFPVSLAAIAELYTKEEPANQEENKCFKTIHTTPLYSSVLLHLHP